MLNKSQKERLQLLHSYDWVDEQNGTSKTKQNLHKILNKIESIEELWYASYIIEWEPAEGDLDFFRNHPLCDKGLALWMYWGLQPDYFYRQKEKKKEFSELDEKHFKAVKEIEQDLLGGRYKKEEISFDPKDVVGREITDIDKYRPGLKKIPKELRKPTIGTSFPLDYSEPVFGTGANQSW
jgi:GH35 family endo-1,4-beta-xylanase